MFDPVSVKDSPAISYLKRIFAAVIVAFVIIALISGYRAWFQVHSLQLTSTDRILRTGSSIQTSVVSYARTIVTVRIELIHGTHAETLATQRVHNNAWALLDPRTQHGSQSISLNPAILSGFESGRALLRATAIGGPQWTRTPPPLVREIEVEIQRN